MLSFFVGLKSHGGWGSGGGWLGGWGLEIKIGHKIPPHGTLICVCILEHLKYFWGVNVMASQQRWPGGSLGDGAF